MSSCKILSVWQFDLSLCQPVCHLLWVCPGPCATFPKSVLVCVFWYQSVTVSHLSLCSYRSSPLNLRTVPFKVCSILSTSVIHVSCPHPNPMPTPPPFPAPSVKRTHKISLIGGKNPSPTPSSVFHNHQPSVVAVLVVVVCLFSVVVVYCFCLFVCLFV